MQRQARRYNSADLNVLDIVIRVKALEALAGVPPRTWPDTKVGLLAATKFWLDRGVRLNEEWIVTGDTGIAKAIFSTAIAKLGIDTDIYDGIALGDDVISGATLKSNPYGEIGAAANYLRRSILERRAGVGHFTALLLTHVKQRASSELRRRQRERGQLGPAPISITPGQAEEGQAYEVPSFTELDQKPQYLSEDPRIKRWIMDQIDEMPGPRYHQEVARAWIEHPEARGLKTDLANEYKVSLTTIITIIDKMLAYLDIKLQEDRRMQKHWEMLMLRSELEAGPEEGGRTATTSLPERIARYMVHLHRCAGSLSRARVAVRWMAESTVL